jgi:hypothetical protein
MSRFTVAGGGVPCARCEGEIKQGQEGESVPWGDSETYAHVDTDICRMNLGEVTPEDLGIGGYVARIAVSLESIARSLERMARPPAIIGVAEHGARAGEPISIKLADRPDYQLDVPRREVRMANSPGVPARETAQRGVGAMMVCARGKRGILTAYDREEDECTILVTGIE